MQNLHNSISGTGAALDEHDEADDHSAVLPALASGPVVLMIDSDAENQRGLITTLRQAGLQVHFAFDGVQGYQRIHALRPDLVLLDLAMSRLDGPALCRRLRAEAQNAHLPLIFHSAVADVDDRLAALASGAVDYIVKPADPREVLARVRIHLRLAARARQGAAVAPGRDGDGGTRPGSGKAVPDDGMPPHRDASLVRAACGMLRHHLASTPRLAALAAQLGTNERRLARAFQQCLGMTVFEYLRRERMRAARRLLRQTGLSIVAISVELGFSSAASFSSAFRAHAGCTPTEFRSRRASAAKFNV